MPVREYGEEDARNLEAVLRSGRLSVLGGGQMLGKFEEAFARAHRAKHGIGMNCAMSVLHASLIAAGVKPGDEVLCDPVCVFGAVAVLYQRATPVFVDCQPVTFNMDPDLMEERITDRTRAVVVTHIGGLPAQMDRICRIARRHGLIVIEDCAHALLARYRGRYVGTWGHIGSFSFQASKQLSLGDGGMAITNRRRLADSLALHAGAPTFGAVASDIHFNYRMNEPTAAIGLAQMSRVRRVCRELVRIGRMWDKAVADFPWIESQQAPEHAEGTRHLWVATFNGDRYGISRKRFVNAIRENGLPFSVGYTRMAAYRHPVFRKAFPPGSYPKGLCPRSERMVPRMVLSNPMVPLADAKRTAERLHEVCGLLR